MISKKKRFVQSQYAHHLRDTETDTHYYLTSEKIGCRDLFDEIEKLTEENEQLKEERNYFERKKCEYFNKYNKKHLDNIQLKEENEQLREIVNKLEEAIEKRGYGSIDEFW